MNADELLKSVFAYGADEAGIRDRFGDNSELYAECFREFLGEPSFAALDTAIKAKDYEQAFAAAHALKGLSGNLGLSPFYTVICALVESLRAERYRNIETECADVRQQRNRLAYILSEGEPSDEPLPADAPKALHDADGDAALAAQKKNGRQLRVMIVAILVSLALVGYLFGRIGVDYRGNVVRESGAHLTEMSNQIKLYIEKQVANDWKIARSVGDSIMDGNYGENDGAIFRMLQRKQEVWGTSDLMLYTENGYCVYANGSTEANDIASETIDKATEHGKYMSVIDSKLIYTVPVETELRYNGARIAAVSVVRDMKTFLDDMRFSSFDERAWMYLTEENGIVISMLTNEAAMAAFNFKAVAQGKTLTPLDEQAPDALFTAPASAAFLMEDGAQKDYVVSVPIFTDSAPLRLFYLAPEEVVNRAMNGFSRQLTAFSMLMVMMFAVLGFLTFLFVYRSRKALFDRALLSRDRMFDLLVKNTQTAFALFNTGRDEPSYVSNNAQSVVGDRYWVLYKDEDGYHMRGSKNADTSVMRQANEKLAAWDGKSVFKSGYICNDRGAVPNYFEYQLYPVDDTGADFVGIAQDVTQTYEREEATKNAMEMATRANEAKSSFLSNMSHDIRTPMNAIVNMTNFALESIDQPKKLGMYLHTIRDSSEHLLRLINDVLDVSRIESGQTVLASEPFDIEAEMRRQAEMVRPLCAAKGQTLITDFKELHTAAVRGDALKLSQIIMNLLSNAVKFTPEKGAIRFTAAEVPSLREDIVDVRFTVEDNGIGISPKDMRRIFAPFCRADDKRVGKIEGAGLGLSICKSYVDAMGGVIRCESEAGEGSTFTVELFFKKAEALNAAEPVMLGDIPFLGMRCLVVEDNAVNRIIAKALLERLGFLVDFAEDGREGVQKFLMEKPGAYDVIYMDIQMPVLDGYQTTARIRASGHAQAETIPIVAMSANVFAEDVEKARIAGMDGYVAKPIVSFDLIEQTHKAITKKRGVQV